MATPTSASTMPPKKLHPSNPPPLPVSGADGAVVVDGTGVGVGVGFTVVVVPFVDGDVVEGVVVVVVVDVVEFDGEVVDSVVPVVVVVEVVVVVDVVSFPGSRSESGGITVDMSGSSVALSVASSDGASDVLDGDVASTDARGDSSSAAAAAASTGWACGGRATMPCEARQRASNAIQTARIVIDEEEMNEILASKSVSESTIRSWTEWLNALHKWRTERRPLCATIKLRLPA